MNRFQCSIQREAVSVMDLNNNFVFNIIYNKTIFGTWEWGLLYWNLNIFFLLSRQLFRWPSLMTTQIFCLICLFLIENDSLDCAKNVYNISQTECHRWNLLLLFNLKFVSFESRARSRTNMRIVDWKRTCCVSFIIFNFSNFKGMLERKILNLCFALTFYVCHNLCWK